VTLLFRPWSIALQNEGVDIRVERQGEVVVLSLQGAIDIVSAPKLKAQFDQELLNRWAPRLVVDCAGVEYVDSYGLGIIAQAVRLARRIRGEIRLCALQPNVQTVLDVSGLGKHISVLRSRSEALASWSTETA